MKILAIRGKNLASLAGDFEVDFQQEPLYSAGLFAITGATGAGKSTLLDALCLALYNRTPRLDKVSNQSGVLADIEGQHISIHDTKNILRRGCTEGFAEVDFVGCDSQTYRAKWSVRRAHNKQTGALQNETISLQELKTEQSIGHKKTEVLAEIENKIGLSFAEFNRAVLLAQNEFFAFLKANDNERAALLEALTGTELFSQLSIKAYQRSKEEKEKLLVLQQQLQQQLPLSFEERQHLEQQINQLTQQSQQAQQRLELLQEQQKWHNTAQQLKQRIDLAQQQFKQFAQDWQHKEQNWHFVQQVQAALPIKPVWIQQQQLEQQQQQLQQQLSQLNDQQTQFTQHEQQLGQQYQQAAIDYQTLEHNWQHTQQPRLAQATQLDFSLSHVQQQLEQAQQQLSQHSQQLKQANYQQLKEWPHIQQQLSAAKQQHKLVIAQQVLADIQHVKIHYQQHLKHLQQQLKQADLANLQQQQQQLNSQQRVIDNSLSKWQHYLEIEMQSQQYWQEQQELLKTLAQEQEQQPLIKQQLMLLQAQLEQAQQALHAAQLACSQNVQQLRQQLENQQPCPVCGSIEHPYHQQQAQTQLNNVLNALQQQVKLAQEHHQQQHIVQVKSQENMANQQKRLKQLEQLLNTATQQQQQIEKQLADNLPVDEWFSLKNLQKLEYLQQAQTLIGKKIESLAMHIQQQQGFQQQKEHTQEAIEACLIIEQCTAALVLVCEHDAQQKTLTLQHQQLLGGQSTQQFEQAWQKQLKQSLQCKESIHQQWISSQQSVSKTLQAIDIHQQQQQQLTQQLKVQKNEFEQAYIVFKQQFPINLEELNTLFNYDNTWLQQQQQSFEKLKQQLAESKHQLSAREQDYTQHQQHDFAKTDYQYISQQLAELQQKMRDEQQQLGAYRQQLKQDALLQQQQQQVAQALQQQQQQAKIWADLNEVIGSSNGQKFRNAAQQMTLDVLLFYTNAHLHDLARRYRLERVKDTLALQVIDTDMGDEIRSVHSLSGGESFLVSLALALGLASLSSQRVKVESLFIDEGFGSLDADTLRVAMDALDILQGQGRKVGVISHVAEMTERIPTQIQLTKGAAGKSKLAIFPSS